MFRAIGDGPSPWESLLPPELLRLPAELARVDALLDDPVFFVPFTPHFHPVIGRPSTPVECYLRLMFLKFRYRLGLESLCAEVSDSICWRRFCRIPLDGRVPRPVREQATAASRTSCQIPATSRPGRADRAGRPSIRRPLACRAAQAGPLRGTVRGPPRWRAPDAGARWRARPRPPSPRHSDHCPQPTAASRTPSRQQAGLDQGHVHPQQQRRIARRVPAAGHRVHPAT
jgi:hypothetical protein